ncbi:MAG: hypothetical protein P4L55_23965 [Syntrophobacteraceae bacterium]|nr:hypothetical protein [Syntrophobacteraceae bacterium]
MKFPVADTAPAEPRLATRSVKNVFRSTPVEVVVPLVVLLAALVDELVEPEAPLIAETRLLKSDCKVSRLVELVEDELEEDELVEESLNCEINAPILLLKFE